MSQYGKNDYWEDRYTKYSIRYLGILNLLTGTKDIQDSRISLPHILTKLTRYLMLVQEILV